MADEPENHTLRLLREIREEMNRRFDGVDNRLSEMEVALAATRTDLAIVKDTAEDIKETARLIEGRLFRLEKHAGFAKA